MLFDIWARAVSKWRGLLVFILLNTASRMVAIVIQHRTDDSRVLLYSSLISMAIGMYCIVQLVLLLTRDREGDQDWPPIWA
jgi:hypothetical protein